MQVAPRDQSDDIAASLSRYRLPETLKRRLIRDAQGGRTYSRISSVQALDALPANSGYCGSSIACCTCHSATLVQAGYVGLMQDNESFYFLAPGYHSYASCGTVIGAEVSVSVINKPVLNGPLGFVTISEGHVGVLMVGAEYRLLPPGTYQWNDSSINYIQTVDITQNEARLGPYSLITVPDGDVAVTFNNGDLVILGMDEEVGANRASRTFFLDDPKWIHRCFITLKEQTDRLEGNDLLSKDNVELVMVAMSQWRIVDPVRAVSRCDTTMEGIRQKINALVRAAIARIVAGTNIGSGPVSGGVSQPVVVAQPASNEPRKVAPKHVEPNEDATLAHLMQSEQATRHMIELSQHVKAMGVEVVAVYVPEKRMKNDDIRREVAKQAVIGIKAEAERSAADAKAYATITAARAEAEAIGELAKAHADAGNRLGDPKTTAARLALTETTAKAMQGAKLTVFSGGPANMPYMLSADQH